MVYIVSYRYTIKCVLYLLDITTQKTSFFIRMDYLKSKIRIVDVKTTFIVPVLIK